MPKKKEESTEPPQTAPVVEEKTIPEAEAAKVPTLVETQPQNAAQMLASAPRPPNKFSLRTLTPAPWKMLAATLSTLITEANFKAAPEGLTFRALDPSHVALIDMIWAKEGFQSYELEGTQTFNVGLEDFSKIVRRAEKDESFELIRSGTEALQIKMGTNREFELHLLDIFGHDSPLPKITYTSKFDITTEALLKVFADINAVSNHITFDYDQTGILTFSGKGDTGKGKARFALADKPKEVTFDPASESAKGTYSLEFLSKIVSASSAEKIHVEYASKMPLRLDFEGPAKLQMHYYLAPRISE